MAKAVIFFLAVFALEDFFDRSIRVSHNVKMAIAIGAMIFVGAFSLLQPDSSFVYTIYLVYMFGAFREGFANHRMRYEEGAEGLARAEKKRKEMMLVTAAGVAISILLALIKVHLNRRIL